MQILKFTLQSRLEFHVIALVYFQPVKFWAELKLSSYKRSLVKEDLFSTVVEISVLN